MASAIKRYFLSLTLLGTLGASLLFGTVAVAANLPQNGSKSQTDCGTPAQCVTSGTSAISEPQPKGQDAPTLGDEIHTIVNALLFILGAISVVTIVVGGIRYTTSGGDSSSIQAAKNTVLYSVVGLVIATLAYAIVNFVISSFSR